MKIIDIDAVEKQKVAYIHNNKFYEISLEMGRANLVCNVWLNNELIYSGLRVVLNSPIMPCKERFNFLIWSAQDEELSREAFNKTQFLIATELEGQNIRFVDYLKEEGNELIKK